MALFPLFPKVRSDLPESYQKIYLEHLKNNRQGRTKASWLTSKMEVWMHRKVALDVRLRANGCATLEIGAGTLNHLLFETKSKIYDIVEPELSLYKSSNFRAQITNEFEDIEDVPLDSKYDRIISIATCEHICNLPDMVAKVAKLLKKGGGFRVAIPNEGAFCWKLGWVMTSALEFKLKYGLDYSMLMKYEHVNTATEVEEILTYFFRHIKVSYLGLSKTLAFYLFFECEAPNIDSVNKYIADKV